MCKPIDMLNNIGSEFRPAGLKHAAGFTLIELIIVMVIIAIGIALATPTYQAIVEKRELTAAAEEITSFIAFAQSEAVKRNKKVTFSWFTTGGHNKDWCMGASLPPKTAPCDCLEEVTTEPDYCSIDSVPYRLTQTDFVATTDNFLHMKPNAGNFSFDPVRGILVEISDADPGSTEADLGAESVDEDNYLFRVHSNMKNAANKYVFKLQIKVNITGRVSICTGAGSSTDADSERRIGGYPIC